MQPGRTCQRCGRTYLRRQFFEAWVKRNPGHRDGWEKVTVKICLHCQDLAETREMFAVAHISIGRSLRRAS